MRKYQAQQKPSGCHGNKTARRSQTYDQLKDTRGILAMGVARSGWSRHGRMVGRDSVGRYRPLSMAFGLEDLFPLYASVTQEANRMFDRIIANGK
jgi:hypothetical protein